MTDTPESRSGSIVHSLTTVAGLAFVGWLAFALWRAAVVRRIGASRFGGVWEERLESLSFIVLAPNVLVLVPAAAAAAAATWLAGPTQELGLAVLLRLIRWSAVLLIGIGILSILHTLFSDINSANRLEAIAIRASGVLLAAAIAVLCRSAGRSAPGG